MAEGKWVFTSFYTQLQVFVTAVPVLIMVKRNYLTSTILKSLVICAGDLTTLAMVFVPKMLLVYKYTDFGRADVSEYVASRMRRTTNFSASAALYERLRLKKSRTVQPIEDDVDEDLDDVDEDSDASNHLPIYEHIANHSADQEALEQYGASGVRAVQAKIALQAQLEKRDRELLAAQKSLSAQEKLARQQAHEMRNKYSPAISLLAYAQR